MSAQPNTIIIITPHPSGTNTYTVAENNAGLANADLAAALREMADTLDQLSA